jgi:pyrroline-5-carboxylate reductase
VGVIGVGRMGSALVRGFILGGVKKSALVVTDKDKTKLERLKKEGIQTAPDLRQAVEKSDVIFLAVKPNDLSSVLDEIDGLVKGKLMLSIVAGVKLAQLRKKLTSAKICRVMPNLACSVGEGAMAYSCDELVGEEERKNIQMLLGRMGLAVEVSESSLDAVTGISGSGPAYFCLVVRALVDAGVKAGLSEDLALKLVAQTAKGTGKMLLETGADAGEIINAVKSPKGTTEKAFDMLKKRGVAEAFVEAVEAAIQRAKELS